jgi:hypothetical protein
MQQRDKRLALSCDSPKRPCRANCARRTALGCPQRRQAAPADSAQEARKAVQRAGKKRSKGQI